MRSHLGGLDFETLSELFIAYESQIETYFTLGETDKALELERFSLKLVERINEIVGEKSDLPMGLSDATISTTNGQQKFLIENGQQNQVFQRRAKRGSKGISPAAKRKIRSCGVLLEERFQLKNLAFVTCTLPTLNETQLREVCDHWSDIVREFFRALTRMLVRKNLSPDYVQVTEIQENRFKQWGQICPHLHFVCQSRRHRRERWQISPADIEFLWMRSLKNILGVKLDCRSATRIENPRKSLCKELGKYLSKGGKIVRGIVDRGMSEYLPSAWYGASRALSRLERSKRIERVGDVPLFLLRNLERLEASKELSFRRVYMKFKCPQTGIEREICVGITGWFNSREALERVLNMQVTSSYLFAC